MKNLLPPHARFAMLVCSALLLNACGQPSTTLPSPVGTGSANITTALEAEQGQLMQDELASQALVDPGRLSGATTINDPAASGGKAVKLAATGSTVRFTMPASLSSGSYVVSVQARAVAYNGNPILNIKSGGVSLARAELSSSTYSPLMLGTFTLTAGQNVNVILTNGLTSGARAAIVDYLTVEPVGAAAPAPAPAPTPTPTPTPAPVTGIQLPPTGKIKWDWQIGAGGDANIVPPAGTQLLDVDGFDTSAAKVAELRSQGIYPVCYLDVGSYEPGRPDSALYPDYLKIQQDPDWPQEYFLDVTDVFKPGSVLASILQARFKMCKDKGFAAIEPDNLQNDENVRGGLITTQQQIDFNGWVADQAHAYGLAVFQKNGPDKILLKDRTGLMMVEKFDGILNEQCQEYSECAALAEYTKRGKLALNAEYKSGLTLNCTQSNTLLINSVKKDLGLVGGKMSGYKLESCP